LILLAVVKKGTTVGNQTPIKSCHFNVLLIQKLYRTCKYATEMSFKSLSIRRTFQWHIYMASKLPNDR